MKLNEILDPDWPEWTKTPEYRAAVEWLNTYSESVEEEAGEVITLENGVYIWDGLLAIDEHRGTDHYLEAPPFKIDGDRIMISYLDLSHIKNFDWIQNCNELTIHGDDSINVGIAVPELIKLCRRLPKMELDITFNNSEKIPGGVSQLVDLPNPVEIKAHQLGGFGFSFSYWKNKYGNGTLVLEDPKNKNPDIEYPINSVFEFQDAMVNHGLERYV